MQLAEIHERTHLPISRLRYVLDNEVVPGLGHASAGRGNARDFSPGESLLLALAAAFFENGLTAPFIKGFIGRFIQDKAVGRFAVPPSKDEIQIFQTAEMFYGRFITSLRPQLTPPWGDSRTKAFLAADYRPVAYVSVDIAELRKRLFS